MSVELNTRHIGGENTRRRNRFTGTASKSRIALLVLVAAGTALGVMFTHSIWALVLGAIALVVVIVITIGGHNGSFLDRRRKSERMKSRHALGTDQYEPYTVAGWDQLTAAARSGNRRERDEAQRAMRRMRWAPDGADGMGWLVSAKGVPAVAWHSPRGEEEYLSVVFSVSGQMHGIESTTKANQASEKWGKFLAGYASQSSLLRGVQTLTRVLPPAAARQSRWAQLELDTNDGTWSEKFQAAFQRMVDSYEEVLLLCTRNAMTPRHYIVCRWPITSDFRDTAAGYGEGRDGWRELMDVEVERATKALRAANLGSPRALQAREVVALMRHQQNPSRGIEAAKQIDPLDSPGLPSHDEFSAHIVEDYDPQTGEPTRWYHRTAAILSENMQDEQRDPFWTMDLLNGGELQMIRTVSFHLRLVPATQARSEAQQNRVLATADQLSKQDKTGMADDNIRQEVTGAEARAADVSPGTGHHGLDWVGYITISTRSIDELARASRRLQDVCATDIGIQKLEWQDSYAAAASGCNYPIARGVKPHAMSFGHRIEAGITSRRQKEALT